MLPAGHCRYSPREIDWRIKYVDFGLSADATNVLSEIEKESLVLAATVKVLRFVAGNRTAQLFLDTNKGMLTSAHDADLFRVHVRKSGLASWRVKNVA
mgnify:CR=1 FL=1